MNDLGVPGFVLGEDPSIERFGLGLATATFVDANETIRAADAITRGRAGDAVDHRCGCHG